MPKKYSKSRKSHRSSSDDDDDSSRRKGSSSSSRNRRRSSSSDSDSRKRYNSKSGGSGSNRRRNRSSDSGSSSSTPPKAKKNSRNRKSRSRSLSDSPDRKLNKNYDFKDGLDELYKGSSNKSSTGPKEMTRMEKELFEKDGFKPQEFKSSRSNRKNDDAKFVKNESNEHEKAMFGITNQSIISNQAMTNLIQSSSLLNNNNNSSNTGVILVEKSIMHQNLFEDQKIKENRWKLKIVAYLNKLDSSKVK